MPSSRNILADAYARRAAAMKRLAEKRRDKMRTDNINNQQNWGGDVMKGASIGGSMGGGMIGAIVGAIAGGAKSSYENYKTRRSAGQSGRRAIGKTLQDAVNPLHGIPDFNTGSQAAPIMKKTFRGDTDRRTPIELIEDEEPGTDVRQTAFLEENTLQNEGDIPMDTDPVSTPTATEVGIDYLELAEPREDTATSLFDKDMDPKLKTVGTPFNMRGSK